jgi:hypothetical protein
MTTPLDKAQLRKLLLVALSSDQPGEAFAALTKVKGALKKAGLDIHWLAELVMATPRQSMPAPFQKTDTQSWLEQLVECAERVDVLWPRELEFVNSLLAQLNERGEGWQPSLKQRKWLADIHVKVASTRSHAS